MTGPEGKYSNIDGMKVYYEVIGQGRPVICVHTAGTDGRIWEEFMKSLTNDLLKKYKVFAPDLPGHGRSDRFDFKGKESQLMLYYAKVLNKFIESLSLTSPVIVGCSMGGNIALQMGVLNGKHLSAIVSCNGGGRTRVFTPEIIENASPSDLLATFRYCGRKSTKETIEKIWNIKKSNPREIYIADLIGFNEFDIRNKLNSIDCPSLIARGEDDPLVTNEIIEDTASRVKHSTKKVLLGVGHYPMIENPEECRNELFKFLES